MNPTEMLDTLKGARAMLEDEKNIVHDYGAYFEDAEGITVLPRWNRRGVMAADWEKIARVCGAGAFLYVQRDINTIPLGEAFAFKGWDAGVTVQKMTRMVAQHRYGDLLGLYDEAIAYWSLQVYQETKVTAHDHTLKE